ncbi:MAG: YfhO family protein, partial [Cystobacter sp.]
MAPPPLRQPSRFAAPGLLLLTSLALFGGALLPGRALYYRDVLHYYWPVQSARMLLGGLPQWNPFHAGGLPFLADIHAGVAYPPNFLFQSLFSFPTAYALLLVLHHFLGQLGLYVFLRRRGLETFAALTGAVAFGLSGYVAGLCNAGPLMSGLAWTPWLLVVLQLQLMPMRKLAVLALLIATQIVSGDPQSALYSALVAAAAVAWFPDRKVQLVALGGAGALGLLLAGVQVFPTLSLLAESTRGGETLDYLANWNLHPARVFELAFPYPFGEYLGTPQFWGSFMVKGPGSIPFALSIYLGVTVWGLAVLGVKRDRLTGFALTLCAVGLLLALGERSPVSFLIEAPPFRFFRYPEKYVVLTTLGFSVLAAAGAQALSTAPSRQRLIPVAVAAVLMGGALLLAWAAPGSALELSRSILDATRTQGSPAETLTNALRAVGTSLVFTLALLGLAALALKRDGGQAVALGALALVAGDLLWTAHKTVWVGPATLFREPEAVARLKTLVGSPPTRVFRVDADFRGKAPRSRDEAGLIERREWELETLKSVLAGAFGLEEVTSYGAVELRRWRALKDALAQKPERMAERYSGCLLLGPPTPPRPDALVSPLSPQLSATRLPQCPPRLRTVTRTTAVSHLDEALARLSAAEPVSLQEALVEEGGSGTYAPAEVSAVELGPRTARARVTASAGGSFLVFATTSHPGWTATLDGEEVPIWNVDAALMGVVVPEGSHQIEFAFTDPGFYPGLQ